MAKKYVYTSEWGLPSGSAVKKPPVMQEVQETRVPPLNQEDPLEEGMATHSHNLAWRIPWTEEYGGLHPQGHKELDMMETTEHACTHILQNIHILIFKITQVFGGTSQVAQ